MDNKVSRRDFIAKASVAGAAVAIGGMTSAYAADIPAGTNLGDSIKTADFTKEKHVPVIDVPAGIKAGEAFIATVTVGKNVPHPNKTEHHISWAALYFKPKNGGPVTELAKFEFTAHGQSALGPDKGASYTDPKGMVSVKISEPGTLIAESYCNIHGLWQSSMPLELA